CPPVAAEMFDNFVRVGCAQESKDGGVAGLNHSPDFLDEVFGDAELVLPPASVNSACSCAGGAPCKHARRQGARRRGCAYPACKRNREGGPYQRPPEAAPGGAFTRSQLKALVNPELTFVVPVDGDRVVKIDRPVKIHIFQLVENFRRPVHVLLETYHYQF